MLQQGGQNQVEAVGSTLVEVLETVLDKGVVIAGDIRVDVAGVELLTIKIRLMVASVDKAKELGMDWWENDPFYSSKALESQENQHQQDREMLENRLKQLEQQLAEEQAKNNSES
ncbi:gas vesicle protein GvpA/GvpJ/GvpM family [Salsuginibacillus halophilus]|uniref:Gas vesicle protein GvpA/GvpJ/GvpM family n=1 Tax=Salsuginibacillus halophilus TaxID=517424 RepID=A0A2P8HLJ4_9BACI|nr:gas vesicle protein [Salsuginibacillus halophilus]PSL47087.1 gas vesicle protein GvpA/GvpJ/GvpM family [Salsuginibacillus halophilus]